MKLEKPEVAMSGVESVDPQSSLWAWLAFDLRRFRLERNLPLSEVGRIIRASRPGVSNFEAGRRRPELKQLRALDEAWRTSGHFVRLFTFAQDGHDPNWFKAHLDYEARARILKIFEPLVIPGLLQTEAYARVALTAGKAKDGVEDIEPDLRTRIARQKILTKPDPPLIWIFLDENVIDRPVGGPETMRDQLARLLEVSNLPWVNLRIFPRSAGYHLGLDGAFKIMTVEPEGDIAYTEAAEGGRLVLDGVGVRKFTVRFDEIGADALSRSASRELIDRAMETMK